jgi:hypothetical protein
VPRGQSGRGVAHVVHGDEDLDRGGVVGDDLNGASVAVDEMKGHDESLIGRLRRNGLGRDGRTDDRLEEVNSLEGELLDFGVGLDLHGADDGDGCFGLGYFIEQMFGKVSVVSAGIVIDLVCTVSVGEELACKVRPGGEEGAGEELA